MVIIKVLTNHKQEPTIPIKECNTSIRN
uniref:Uncharacterized protein n=1 Tax=Rhizophora mucronata TaxID=61149 RepID=A0A2P2PI05_RHIMU